MIIYMGQNNIIWEGYNKRRRVFGKGNIFLQWRKNREGIGGMDSDNENIFCGGWSSQLDCHILFLRFELEKRLRSV